MANLFNHSFEQAPVGVHLERSVFKLDHSNKLTGNAGDLIPMDVQEIYPGDTVSLDLSAVCRMSTPLTPVMDDAFLDVFYFFVPDRIIWSHWEELMGENKTDSWTEKTEWILPAIGGSSANREGLVGSALDYLGYLGACDSADPTKAYCYGNVLPLGAYVKVWNDWFRDENTQSPQLEAFDFPSGSDPADGLDGLIGAWSPKIEADITKPTSVWETGGLLPINKIHDYFTSCLPAPQKGDAVSFGLSGDVPVVTKITSVYSAENKPQDVLRFVDKNTGTFVGIEGVPFRSIGVSDGGTPDPHDNGGLFLGENQQNIDGSFTPLAPSNLYAQLSKATSTTINQLRESFALQSYLEADARGGSRYVEMLYAHFGVDGGDYRLARPEFLGGQRIRLGTNQVVATMKGGSANLGDTAGFTYGSFAGSLFTKSFTEHGVLLGVCGLRTRHTYAQGLDRFLIRSSRSDFYSPEFANIGEQPVYKEQLYADKNDDGSPSDIGVDVFGFQEAWAELRYFPSKVHGLFRPDTSGTLSAWSYTDDFSSAPVLNSDFMRETKNNIDRTLAVSSSTAPQFLADFYVTGSIARVLPTYSVPFDLVN